MTKTTSEGATSTGVGAGIVALEQTSSPESLTAWGEWRKQLEAFEGTETARQLDQWLALIGAAAGDLAARKLQEADRRPQDVIHKSKPREDAAEIQRLIISLAMGIAVPAAARGARHGLRSWTAWKERQSRLERIWDVLAVAARDADGQISMPAQAKIGALLQQVGASPAFCRKALDQRVGPKSLIDTPRLDDATFSSELRKAVGHVVVFSVGAKVNEAGFVGETILPSFLRDTVGLDDELANSLARRTRDITEEGTEELSALSSEAIRHVAKIAVETQVAYPRLDVQRVLEVSQRLASYDPDKQRREKLQSLLKAGGLAALMALEPSGLGKAGLGKAAAVASHAVAKAMLGGAFKSAPERDFLTRLSGQSAIA